MQALLTVSKRLKVAELNQQTFLNLSARATMIRTRLSNSAHPVDEF